MFVKGLDEHSDYLRIAHSLWHILIGISTFYLWQLQEKKFVSFKEHFKNPHVIVLENIIERPAKEKNPCLGSGPFQLLFLGRIGDRKGIFDLLQVFHQYRADLEGKVILTIGGDGEVERLKKYIMVFKKLIICPR